MTFVASMEPNRLDIFGVSTDRRMYRKAWVGNAAHGNWEDLGGRFSSPPAVVAREPNRLDIFAAGPSSPAAGAHDRMYHKGWDGNTWQPSGWEWHNLGGEFLRL